MQKKSSAEQKPIKLLLGCFLFDSETSPRYEYIYGPNGTVGKVKDNNLNRTVETEYDLADRPIVVTHRDSSGNLLYRTSLDYDKCHIQGCGHTDAIHCEYTAKGNLTQFKEEIDGRTHLTAYQYDKDNRTTQVQFGDTTHKVSYTYDALGRVTTRSAVNGSNTASSTYTYAAGYDGGTTPLVTKITQPQISFEYVYDNAGNITSEKRGSKYTTYQYDALGQLIRVNDQNDTTSGTTGTTWTYSYDRGGNIVSKTRYAYAAAGTSVGTALQTISYTYGDSNWKDKLTKYNGTTLSYDAIGNLTGDGTWTYTWQAGRQLKQMSKSGTTVQFKYGYNGMRIQKVVNSTTTEYTYHGTLLTNLKQGSNYMHFYYDAQGRPAMVDFNGTKYMYLHNLQGDIVGLLDSSGSLVVQYRYDAWGKLLATSTLTSAYTTLANLNLLRYRGYVYDTETGLYYLRSRYYKAEWGRFINADTLIGFASKVISHNQYAYCSNKPIVSIDETGELADHPPMGYYKNKRQMIDDNTAEIEYNMVLGGVIGNDGLGPTNYGPVNGYRYPLPNTEIWYGPDGKPIHSRHWSNHGNDKLHPLVPHDHDWHDDDRGNRTESKKWQAPDPNYISSPEAINNHKPQAKKSSIVEDALMISAGSILAYEIIKWGIAILLSPVTGGSSIGAALATP